MDDELKHKFIQYIDSLEALTNSGSQFAVNQAPLVVQEYLRWYLLNGIAGIIFSILLSLLLTWPTRKCLTNWRNGSATDSWDIGTIFLCGFQALPLFIFCFNAYSIIKVLSAPRIVVLEKIASLL